MTTMTTGDLTVTTDGEAINLGLDTGRGGYTVRLGESEALQVIAALWEGLIKLDGDLS